MLKVWYETTDYTLEAEDYTSDTLTLTLADDEFIYIGHRKPINEIYVFMDTANTNSSVVTIDYHNGLTFTPVSDLVDRTIGFSRSDFIRWERDNDDEEETTINSIEAYWYRIRVDVTTSEMVFRGINLLFSDDNMIKEDEPHLLSSSYYPSGESSFIYYHQSARNELMQRLRNKAYTVKDNAGNRTDLSIFDLHDRSQLSVASKYLVLSKIYFVLSDGPEDKYYQKFVDYKAMSDDAFNVFFLSVDFDDDGKVDKAEKSHFVSGLITRV